MENIFNNEIILIAITFALYAPSKRLQRKTGLILLNPVFLTIAILIILIKLFNINYETYANGGRMIEFWLKPAVVALGVPLYLHLKEIKRQLLPILVSQIIGSIAGILSVVGIAYLLGASNEVIISLSPKSVTTPIAMEISNQLGGIPSLTSAVVVCVGIFGAIFGYIILKTGRVKSAIGQGLAMGTASHAVGTSAAMEWGNRYGTYAGLGLTLNGILTAIFTPYILQWLGFIP
jgi:predicted murein hydrolase (TIGR00659 family)